MDTKKSCCFTGHRHISNEDILRVVAMLDELIAEHIGKGFTRYLAGGALGFDTLAAQAVLRAREKNNGIKLVIVQPCRDQDVKWHEADKSEYRRILTAADEVICLSDHYYNGCMQKRNRYLVNNSGLCIAYMRDTRGGTAYTVQYAQKQNIPVINIGM